MKAREKQGKISKANLKMRRLAQKMTAAEQVAKAVHQEARAAKARYKEARKAYKQARKAAKQMRKKVSAEIMRLQLLARQSKPPRTNASTPARRPRVKPRKRPSPVEPSVPVVEGPPPTTGTSAMPGQATS